MILATTQMNALLNVRNFLQISIKLEETKPFNSNTKQAQACLSILELYFIAIGITYKATKASDIDTMYHYAVALMGGSTARFMWAGWM